MEKPTTSKRKIRLSSHLRRGNLLSDRCPSRAVLRHITSHWGVLVFIVLLTGTHRFSEMRRKIGGVSEKMLAETLQALETDGFVLRTVHPVMPPHVDYALTPMGRQIGKHVQSLANWIETHMDQIMKTN